MSRPPDLLQGTLELLLLKIVALEPMHGWAIAQRLRQMSGEVLQVSDGSLYPALHKLEQAGLIQAEWRATENKRRAKFYEITEGGHERLAHESREWDRLSSAVALIMRAGEA
jgi:PadR family transcriptional regulator, regulatory protein PadR